MTRIPRLRRATRTLCRDVSSLEFSGPVTHVYNPLEYARKAYNLYLKKWGDGPRPVLFLGMNPGPFGMAQTGIPFGEIASVRDWLDIDATIGQPDKPHPKRPVEGFECTRQEVSGSRLWGAIAEHWGTPKRFFARHFVANYCPLVFMEESGRNRTPDKLPAVERELLFECCDRHLRRIVDIWETRILVGVGAFATARAREALRNHDLEIGTVLHPSPASPRANRGWSEQATRELQELGICRARRRKA
ncbi:MAG: uracil-DNA glycosylase family protein [Myxococcota bacterium]|nr:uracil-DNA glycosylase family protein [Myxococcota bacterium]